MRHRPDPGRIAVIVTRQIGDVLLTTPMIAAARRRWPEASIDVFGFAGTLGMLAGNGDVSACIETPSRPGIGEAVRFVSRHGRRYDLALVAEASDHAHALAFILARTRAGLIPDVASHAWWKRLLLHHAVVAAGDRGDRHVVDEKLALLAPWHDRARAVRGATVKAPGAGPLPDDIDRAIDGAAAAVIVHAPSMWSYKQWPVDRFAALVRALATDGCRVVLTGSASARDRTIVDAVRAAADVPGIVDTAGRLDFRQLATLLSRAALYIGPDGSVTHLAAACGVPVVAIFGPTDPRRWGPLAHRGENAGDDVGASRYVRVDVVPQRSGRVVLLQGAGAGSCVPCGRAGCDDHRESRSACLEAIGVDRVLAEARRLLAGRSNPAAAADGAPALERSSQRGASIPAAASTTAPGEMPLTSAVGDTRASPS